MKILVSGSTRVVAKAAEQFADHVGHLVVPRNGNSIRSLVATGLPWAIDNGAYTGFDARSFRRLLLKAVDQPRLCWVVAPDVVGDARATIALFRDWQPELAASRFPVALAGQDGLEDLEVPYGAMDCLFVGGSTRWKLSLAAADLMVEAKRRGLRVHVGRVNSLRRLRMAYERGADSVDGSSYSRWHHRTLTNRPDMSLTRHLNVLRCLERQPSLWP